MAIQLSRCFFLFLFDLQTGLVAENRHHIVKEMTSLSLSLDARTYHPRKGDHGSSQDRNADSQPRGTASPRRSKALGLEGQTAGKNRSRDPGWPHAHAALRCGLSYASIKCFISLPRISI